MVLLASFHSKAKNTITLFKSHNTFRRRLVHPKDKVPQQTRSGIIYQVTCADCPHCYIGETGRTLNERLKEHKRALRLNNPSHSAIAEHAYNTGHNIEWDNATIIDFESNIWKRKVKESLWINRIKPTLNRDTGYILSPIYGPVINRKREGTQRQTTH